jgi:hypothetical protein
VTPGERLIQLYPRAWQRRYADEMLAVLEERPPGIRDRLDLARGALDAHLHPEVPSRVPVLASLTAGAAWILLGTASLLQQAPPDWPGYLASTLGLAIAGALVALVAVLGVSRRWDDRGGRAGSFAVALAIAGHAIWIAALVMAAIGGPYGAVTAASQALAALGTVAIGLVVVRGGDGVVGGTTAVIGVAMVVPSPAAWLVVGGGWTAIGLRQAVERVDRGDVGGADGLTA